MRLARAGKAASCPPERRDLLQEVVVRKMGARRAIILLAASMALLFLASGLLPTEPSAQTTSPEGKIVFVRQGTEPSNKCDGQPCADLWVMDAEGTNQTNLTNTPDDLEYQPSWAPSGAQITFVREIPGEVISEQSDIFVMDANGQTPATNLTQTDANEHAPDWSPDGTKIAFAGVRKATSTATACPTATATATATASATATATACP